MRILTTSLCYPTPEARDQGIFIQRRAAALAARPGVEVQVVCPQPWCPWLRPRRDYPDAAEPLHTAYPRMVCPPPLNWATDGLSYARTLVRFVRRHQAHTGQGFDLIDAHFVYPEGVGAWLAGRTLGIPVVVTIRGKIVSLSQTRIRRRQIQAMLPRVDARIAVSESLAGAARALTTPDLPVEVIPNGVNPRIFKPMDRGEARRLLGWEPNARYVLSVGHLQRLKGFHRLLEILPALRKQCGDIRLVLAGSQRGEPDYRRDVLAAIDRVNLAEPFLGEPPAALFTGPVGPTDLNLMYNAADVLVNASSSEGWNNAIGEALAAGTPVVATRVGGNAEQLCSPELGLLVAADHSGALAGGIVRALRTDWNRPLIAAHGGARTPEHVADEVLAVFRRVIDAYARRSRSAEAAQPDPRDAIGDVRCEM